MFKPKGVLFLTLIIVLMAFSCSGPESDQPLLTAELPLHLEEHLDAAYIEGSEVPKNVLPAVEWNFDELQPDWKPAIPINQTTKPVKVIRTEDALRVILNESNFNPKKRPAGGIYIDLPGWHREEWAYIMVRARTSEKIRDFSIGFNLREESATPPYWPWPFRNASGDVPMINDGSVHTYLIRADNTPGEEWEGPWQQFGIWFVASEPASIDILSVSVIPKEAMYASTSTGVNTEIRNNAYRRTLYTHVPGRLEYKVRVPEAGRLDVALGVLRDDAPVTFRISAVPKGKELEALLFEETYADIENWAQRSVDISHLAGKTVKLVLEAESERAGTIAFWAAPTVTGARKTKKPNVIFYIIDGAAAEHMSVYGYNRRTTPNLERLAKEGVVFEYAYSNSSWTKISNPSFMTSLHSSVIGPLKNESQPIPQQAVNMAQHMHRAGYQTAAFVSNAFCGTMSGLDRGVDVLREAEVKLDSKSSVELHKDFWSWREAYPGAPYWVHFQTTDVHWPWKPSAPFAGLYVDPELRKTFEKWTKKFLEAEGTYEERIEKTGIDRVRFFNLACRFYDETMAHQDHQLGKLVERLKAAGEWEHTLFIVAADHSQDGAGLRLLDPLPPKWGNPILASQVSRIPMIIIWPEKIAPGQRLSQPVSMIDVLPTILELAGLPEPEMMQGQSLHPLLLGKDGWEPRPVIFDEFYIREDNEEAVGTIEVIDGRWGASLKIGKDKWEEEEDVKPERLRPAPLLLYDVWNDPYCLHSLHEERPDLVKKYTKFLEDKWNEHKSLSSNFSRPRDVPLTPEQLETLRSLGYIR